MTLAANLFDFIEKIVDRVRVSKDVSYVSVLYFVGIELTGVNQRVMTKWVRGVEFLLPLSGWRLLKNETL